jgi:glyoxylase-like metal-dependent hydrolase (beta-lactamase superfamily II)
MLRIVRVLAPNPSVYTLEGTNTWVVGAAPAWVIDPGPPDADHAREVRTAAGAVAGVLLTHAHEDHAEGAAAFAATVGAPLYAWRLDGARPIRDGDVFASGGAALRALHAPGHSADHVVFHLESERALFTGDAVLGRGTSFIDPPDGDLAKYLASLERMLALGPRTIYPGHGPVVLDGDAKLREYLAHRAEREQQVLAALADAPRTVEELVESIYVGYPVEVHPLAARSVTAHLRKLRGEGRVHSDGRGKTQTWAVAPPTACRRCGKRVKGAGTYCASCSLALLQGA